MWQVYKITHRETGRAYIGVTSMTLPKRITYHKVRQNPIGAAMRQHGDDAFTVEVLSTHGDKESGMSAESEAIWQHGTHDPVGYNRRVRGGKYPGCGPQHFGNKFSRRRAVSAFDRTGKLVQTYDTVMDAAKALCIHRNTIHRAIAKPHYTAGGYHWKDAGSPAPHGG